MQNRIESATRHETIGSLVPNTTVIYYTKNYIYGTKTQPQKSPVDSQDYKVSRFQLYVQ